MVRDNIEHLLFRTKNDSADHLKARERVLQKLAEVGLKVYT